MNYLPREGVIVIYANRFILKKKSSGGSGEMFVDYHLLSWGCFFTALITVFWEWKKVDFCEFQASLVYIVISRPARTTVRQFLLRA